MSYHRTGFGDDGLITSPTQVDPTLPAFDPTKPGEVIGVITNPNRVPCESLAPDDPWRKPGGPCAPQETASDWVNGIVGKLKGAFSWLDPTPTTTTTTTSTTPPAPPSDSVLPTVLLLAAAGGAAYYLTRKKKVA